MANAGSKPQRRRRAAKETMSCLKCGSMVRVDELYGSQSVMYASIGKIPYCKACLDEMFHLYTKQIANMDVGEKLYRLPERKAIERICMMTDVYYSDEIFESAVNIQKANETETSLICWYLKQSRMAQYKSKRYLHTLEDRMKEKADHDEKVVAKIREADRRIADIEMATKLFGSGFTDDDYLYLYEQYADWTTRHECETKAQEEVFKRICFKQLEILKATRRGDDTKDLDMVFQKLLDTAKLQPKQNSGETVSDAQTFGTLIDKWENTRPIPEVEEELKDVDKIGFLIHVFFTGHIAKVLNLPSSLSNLYEKYIKKYTVEKQEYSSESDSEVMFDKIFGKKSIDE